MKGRWRSDVGGPGGSAKGMNGRSRRGCAARKHSDALAAWQRGLDAIAQAEGVPAKFPGSGGAVVGMCRTEEERERVKAAFEDAGGYVFTKLSPHEPEPPGPSKRTSTEAYRNRAGL